MKGLRTAFGIMVLVLLALGYAASQVAFFQGTAPEYAAKVDVPQIRWLALTVLAVWVALTIWSPEEKDAK